MIPVHCVSLVRAEARREKVIGDWAEKGFDIQLFDAFDRRDLDMNDLSSHTFPVEPVWRRFDNPARNRLLTSGEIACYTSHLLLIDKLIADGVPEAIVIEDDAIPAEDAESTEARIRNVMKWKSSALVLTGSDVNRGGWARTVPSFGPGLLFSRAPWGTYFLYYTKMGMIETQKLLPIRQPFDHALTGLCQLRELAGVREPMATWKCEETYIETAPRGVRGRHYEP